MENNTAYRSPSALNAELHAFWSQQDSLELNISKQSHEAKDLQTLVDIAQDHDLTEEMLQAKEMIVAARELHSQRGARITDAALLIRTSGKTDPAMVQHSLQDERLPEIADLTSQIDERLQSAKDAIQKVNQMLASSPEPAAPETPEPTAAPTAKATEPEQPEPAPVTEPEQAPKPEPAPAPEPEPVATRPAPQQPESGNRPIDILANGLTEEGAQALLSMANLGAKVVTRQWQPKEAVQTAQPRRKHYGPVPTKGKPATFWQKMWANLNAARNQDTSDGTRQ